MRWVTPFFFLFCGFLAPLAQVAVIKGHRLGGLDGRCAFPHSSGDQSPSQGRAQRVTFSDVSLRAENVLFQYGHPSCPPGTHPHLTFTPLKILSKHSPWRPGSQLIAIPKATASINIQGSDDFSIPPLVGEDSHSGALVCVLGGVIKMMPASAKSAS